MNSATPAYDLASNRTARAFLALALAALRIELASAHATEDLAPSGAL